MPNNTLREPKYDCINYRASSVNMIGFCRGLKELYCAKELNGCPFYKSKYEYDMYGYPLCKRGSA